MGLELEAGEAVAFVVFTRTHKSYFVGTLLWKLRLLYKHKRELRKEHGNGPGVG